MQQIHKIKIKIKINFPHIASHAAHYSGGSRGRAWASHIFRPKIMRPKGPKNYYLRPGPPTWLLGLVLKPYPSNV